LTVLLLWPRLVVSVMHRSVCPSVRLTSFSNIKAEHTQRDSPGGSSRCGRRTFPTE